jgi:hypothetical protein
MSGMGVGSSFEFELVEVSILTQHWISVEHLGRVNYRTNRYNSSSFGLVFAFCLLLLLPIWTSILVTIFANRRRPPTWILCSSVWGPDLSRFPRWNPESLVSLSVCEALDRLTIGICVLDHRRDPWCPETSVA